jgi:hypothetical protein
MRKISALKASQLVMDFDIYPREQVSNYNVDQIVKALEAGVELPAIIVDSKSLRIIDGFHRLRAYKKEIFLDAIRLNASHGRQLTKYDKARCIAKAEAMEIDMSLLAGGMNIDPAYLGELKRERVATYEMKPIMLKGTTAHLAGTELTKEQVAYNKKAGGMNQSFYINQVIAMLASDAVDWENERVIEGLKTLLSLLKKTLKPVRA